jgi:hypothetical protein
MGESVNLELLTKLVLDVQAEQKGRARRHPDLTR